MMMSQRKSQDGNAMIKLPVQFHSSRRTTIGDNLLVLLIPEGYIEEFQALTKNKVGTQFIAHFEEVDENSSMNKPTDLEEKEIAKMHALLGQLADIKGTDMETQKEKLREELRKRGVIDKSTKELKLKDRIVAVNIVAQWINEANGTC